MSKPDAFIIPAGLTFEQSDDGLTIEHDGDIVLHSTLGLPLKRVRSTGGSVELHVEADNLTELSASGSVIVHGAVKATRISGARIEIGGDATVEALEAGAEGMEIAGSVTAHEVSSGGGIEIAGGVTADTLSASGDVSISDDAQIDLLSTDSGSISLGSLTAKAVASGGDLSIGGDLSAEEVTATSGDIRISGDTTAKRIRGVSVSLSGGSNTISSVQGLASISVSGGQIRSDILIAPDISIAPETTGKITVLETHGDPGPNAVKGCLGLSDLEEFGVDTSSYLSDRNLTALGEPGEPAAADDDGGDDDDDGGDDGGEGGDEPEEPVVEADEAESVADEIESEADEDESTPVEIEDFEDEDDPLEEPTQAEAISIEALGIEAIEDDLADIDLDEVSDTASFSVVAEASDAEIEVEEDIADLGALELSPLEDEDEHSIAEVFDLNVDDDDDDSEAASNGEDPLYGQLRETITQIESCYEGSELPPAVTQLGELADARNYVAIRDDITNIWHQLLKFHQKRGLRIQPQVTTTFNTINTLVRKI